MVAITGSIIRDILMCDRRAHLDTHADPHGRDEVPSFVQMLWNGGCAHEERIVDSLPGRVLDLRREPARTRAMATRSAMSAEPDWIVGGRLEAGDRIGVPDLLLAVDGTWHAGDIKSGSAFGPSGSPKRDYAAQIGHYCSLLEDLGWGSGDRGFVVDRAGALTWYDMHAPRRAEGTIAEEVAGLVHRAREIISGAAITRPALSSAALCHWRTSCRDELEIAGDLTLIAGMGAALREVLEPTARTINQLAAMPDDWLATVSIPKLSQGQLKRFRDRARLLTEPGARPFARAPLDLPRHGRELHLDLESNPLDGGLVYLHGIVERFGNEERYHAFFAEDHADEERAFQEDWTFLHSKPLGHVYHYSRFECTSYRALAHRFPSVCSQDDVENLFSRSRSTDLLVKLVQPLTEWPTNGLGIKPLAKHLGFAWRDRDASGAASIGWFVEWCATRAPETKRRILDYNLGDCMAICVLLDALRSLPVMAQAPWGAAATGEA